MHPVRAKIEQLQGLSAHADRSALLGWLKQFKSLPREILLTHGEEDAALSLAQEVEALGAGKVSVPAYLDARDLG